MNNDTPKTTAEQLLEEIITLSHDLGSGYNTLKITLDDRNDPSKGFDIDLGNSYSARKTDLITGLRLIKAAQYRKLDEAIEDKQKVITSYQTGMEKLLQAKSRANLNTLALGGGNLSQ